MKFTYKSPEAWAFALILIFYALMLAFQIELPAAEDLGRHLKNGELILKGNFDVLYYNVYSYTMPEQPFVNHHWLAGVVFYLVHQVVGWNGLVVFKIIVLLTTFILLFLTSVKRSSFWVVALFSIPAMLLMLERATLRPENFSYLFMAVFLYFFVKHEDYPNRNTIFWLVPVQAIWVNMHIFFIFGPAMAGVFLLDHAFRVYKSKKSIIQDVGFRKCFILCILLGLVCVVNPNGITGALYPLNIFKDYGMVVTENLQLSRFIKDYVPGKNISVLVFYPALLALLGSFLFGRKRFSIFYFIFTCIVTYGAIKMVRLVAPFGLFFMAAVTYNFNGLDVRASGMIDRLFRQREKVIRWLQLGFNIIVFFLVVLKATGVILYGPPSIGLSPRSNDSAEFFIREGLKGPIFNDYDIGSYLDFHLYPDEKVFVDNRPEAFTSYFFEELSNPAYSNDSIWNMLLGKYQFNAIFIFMYDEGKDVFNFINRRYYDPEWSLVFADPYSVVYLRNVEANAGIIEKYAITADNAEARFDYLLKSDKFQDQVCAADVLSLVGAAGRGLQAYFDIVDRWPEKGRVWMIMAKYEQISDNFKSPLLAIMYLNKAIDAGYKTADVYTELGYAYWRMGYLRQARQAGEKALKIDPEWQPAKNLMNDTSAK